MLCGGLLIGCLRYQAPTSQGYCRIYQEMQSKWTRLTWLEIKRSVSIIGYGGKAIVHYKEIVVVNKNERSDLNFVVPFEAKSMLTETEVMAQTGFLIFFDEELAGVSSIVDPLKPGVQDFWSILKPITHIWNPSNSLSYLPLEPHSYPFHCSSYLYSYVSILSPYFLSLPTIPIFNFRHHTSLSHFIPHYWFHQPIARLLHLAHLQNPSIGYMEVLDSLTHVHGDHANLVIIPIPISHHPYTQFSL